MSKPSGRVTRIGKKTDRVATEEELTKFILREGLPPRREDKSSGGKNPKKKKKGKKGKGAKDLHSPATLKATCVERIADHFEDLPYLDKIPAEHLVDFYNRVSPTLDIVQASKSIADENYWKRRAEREGLVDTVHVDLSEHGLLWKRLYFERALHAALEKFGEAEGEAKANDEDEQEDDTEEKQALEHLLKAARGFVWVLELEQGCAEIDPKLLLTKLTNLAVLKLTYGVKKIGMDFAKEKFGMKVADATVLADALKGTTTLTTLKLPCNLVDDDTARLLLTGLLGHPTITSLDLSHNRITNTGAKQIAKLLGTKNVLVDLDLSDNQIHVEGSRSLGRALARNRSLLRLSLRLNRMTDEGGRVLLESLAQNTSLEELDVSSNSLGSESCFNLASLISRRKSALQICDMSANELSDGDLTNLKEALEVNKRMIALDLRRNTKLSEEAEVVNEIAALLKANELNNRVESLSANHSEEHCNAAA